MTVGLASNQSSPEVIVNQADHGYLAKSVAGGTDVALTDNEATYAQLEFTGALTANINVSMADVANVTHIYNNTSGAFTLTVIPVAGSGVAVTQGNRVMIGLDGAGNAYALTAEV